MATGWLFNGKREMPNLHRGEHMCDFRAVTDAKTIYKKHKTVQCNNVNTHPSAGCTMSGLCVCVGLSCTAVHVSVLCTHVSSPDHNSLQNLVFPILSCLCNCSAGESHVLNCFNNSSGKRQISVFLNVTLVDIITLNQTKGNGVKPWPLICINTTTITSNHHSKIGSNTTNVHFKLKILGTRCVLLHRRVNWRNCGKKVCVHWRHRISMSS